MNEQKLPENYKGFSTAELLQLWEDFGYLTYYDPKQPREKQSAWRDLLREYKIMDFDDDSGLGSDPEKVLRSKRLLAPFGIDPAPWADETGKENVECRKANWKVMEKKEKEMHDRRRKQEEELKSKGLLKYHPSDDDWDGLD